MLTAVPDLRRAALNGRERRGAFRDFRGLRLDDHTRQARQRLHLAAAITPELLPVLCPNESDRPEGRSQINGIAGEQLVLRHGMPVPGAAALGIAHELPCPARLASLDAGAIAGLGRRAAAAMTDLAPAARTAAVRPMTSHARAS